MNNTRLIWRERQLESDFVASVWSCHASVGVMRTVLSDPSISISLVKAAGTTTVVVTGPETRPRSELLAPGYTCTTIRLQPGVLLKGFPVQEFVNGSLALPADAAARFWFGGSHLQFPDFDNAELFVEYLHRHGYLGREISDTQNAPSGLSPRTYSRLIKRTTGLSPYQLHQLQRLQRAFKLLKQGVSATAVAIELDFVDQSHLTRVTKQFFGHTPKQLLGLPHIP